MFSGTIVFFAGTGSIIFILVLFFWWYLLFLRTRRIKKIKFENIRNDEIKKVENLKKRFKNILKWGIVVILILWIIAIASVFFLGSNK